MDADSHTDTNANTDAHAKTERPDVLERGYSSGGHGSLYRRYVQLFAEPQRHLFIARRREVLDLPWVVV